MFVISIVAPVVDTHDILRDSSSVVTAQIPLTLTSTTLNQVKRSARIQEMRERL